MKPLATLLLLSLLGPGGCTNSTACLELAQKRCECCLPEQVENCQAAMEQQHTRNAPSELEEQRCEDDARTYRGCQDVDQAALDQICVLVPER